MDISQLQVLIVDDFEVVRMMLRNSLVNLGVKNITDAQNGRIAKELIEAKIAAGSKYDVIFCDWNMPEMDGYQLLQFCKGNPNIKSVPFIMVTAEAESNAIMSAVRAGANDYVVKPFSPAVIHGKLSRLLTGG